MTVRRSAGGEAVKGSVRSAWYAKTVLSFAFGVEGSAGGVLPARMCQHCAFGEQDNGGGNAAGHARIVCQLTTIWFKRAILH